jgi:hypothetical protein
LQRFPFPGSHSRRPGEKPQSSLQTWFECRRKRVAAQCCSGCSHYCGAARWKRKAQAGGKFTVIVIAITWRYPRPHHERDRYILNRWRGESLLFICTWLSKNDHSVPIGIVCATFRVSGIGAQPRFGAPFVIRIPVPLNTSQPKFRAAPLVSKASQEWDMPSTKSGNFFHKSLFPSRKCRRPARGVGKIQIL